MFNYQINIYILEINVYFVLWNTINKYNIHIELLLLQSQHEYNVEKTWKKLLRNHIQ